MRLAVRPAGVGRAGIDRVHRDPALDDRVGQREDQLGQRPFGRPVADLAGHRAQVLTRGEQHHPAAFPGEPGGELLHQQQGGTHVDRPAQVQLLGGQLTETARTGSGVVAHQGIQAAEPVHRRADQRSGGLRPGKVGLGVRQPRVRRAERAQHTADACRVGAVRLGGIVRGPGVREHRRAVGQQPAGDREADPGPPAHPGHEHPSRAHRSSLTALPGTGQPGFDGRGESGVYLCRPGAPPCCDCRRVRWPRAR